MPNQITIHFSGFPVYVDWESFHRWFPGMSSNHDLNGESLTATLHNLLYSRFNINQMTIRKTLKKLFGFMKPSSNHIFGETRLKVTEALNEYLEHDSNPYWADLQRTRHAFTVLAYLANMYNSRLLAGALLDFWYAGSQTIMQKEREEHWHEWQRSRLKVEHLGSEGMLHVPAPMGMLMPPAMQLGGWPRERSTHQHTLGWPDSRALSAPNRRHRSISDVRVALPRSGWTTPVHTPMSLGYPRADYFNEMGDLYWQREEMNAKLDNIGMKVDHMLVRSM